MSNLSKTSKSTDPSVGLAALINVESNGQYSRKLKGEGSVQIKRMGVYWLSYWQWKPALSFLKRTTSTGLSYRFQCGFSPRMPVNVYNNLPEPSPTHDSGLSFLAKCLSNEYLEMMEATSFASKMVEAIFGPIMLRSRFMFTRNPVESGDVAQAFDFGTLKWKSVEEISILNENWFAFEESRKVHDADCSFVNDRVSKEAPAYEGQTRGEMRLKWYNEFDVNDEYWKGPYNATGLDSFIDWYQRAREVVEDEKRKEVEGVVITDSLRAMAGKLADQAASEAVLIHALGAQLSTPSGLQFLEEELKLQNCGDYQVVSKN